MSGITGNLRGRLAGQQNIGVAAVGKVCAVLEPKGEIASAASVRRAVFGVNIIERAGAGFAQALDDRRLRKEVTYVCAKHITLKMHPGTARSCHGLGPSRRVRLGNAVNRE